MLSPAIEMLPEVGVSNPEIILSTNQEKGFTKIECNNTTIDVSEAKAANTLICPTL